MEPDELEKLYEAKKQERRRRAQMPFEDKIRALVRMQKRKAEIAKLRGEITRVWDIDL